MMKDDNEKLIEQLMEPLRVRYLKALLLHQKKLKPFITRRRKKPLTNEERENIRYLAHRSMGTGKVFGFPDITTTGCRLEERLLATPRAKDDVILRDLEKFLDACDAAQKAKKLQK